LVRVLGVVEGREGAGVGEEWMSEGMEKERGEKAGAGVL